MMETEMLMDARTAKRLMISKEPSGEVRIGVFNDKNDTSTILTIGRGDIQHLYRSLEEFKNKFVDGTSLGGLEIHGKPNSGTQQSGPAALRKHGTEYNYFTFNTGVFSDGRELAYEFQDSSFYHPEMHDIDVLIEWLGQNIN